MVFGDKDRIAIEFELDEDHGGAWMYGRICYWLCGQPIGDYELGTSLRDVMLCWVTIEGDAGHRVNENLMLLETEELGKLLRYALFGHTDVDPEIESRALEEQWACHVIVPGVDVFDEWQVFLVESGSVARCVYYQFRSDTYRECRLKYGEFDSVLAEAMQSLRQIYALYDPRAG